MQLMILIAIIPTVIVDAYVLSNYESRAVKSRSVTVKNQCDILCDKLVRLGIFDNPDSEIISSQFEMLTGIYGGRIIVVDKNYRIIKDTYSLSEGKYLISSSVIDCFSGEETSQYFSQDKYVEMTIKITDPDAKDGSVMGVMLMNFSTKEISDNTLYMEKLGMTALAILILLIIFGGFALSGFIVKPLKRITNALSSMHGDVLKPIPPENAYNETLAISEALNKLISQVTILNESRSDFVANVSHELKTPLASMKVLADCVLMNPETTVEEYRDFMTDISSEIDRESAIITDLLSLVCMDRKSDSIKVTETNINELLDLVVKRLLPIAEEAGVELTYECFRPVNAQVDPTKMALIMTNLIENGIKYNKKNGWVKVALNSDNDFMYLTVSDSGIGIPKDAFDHIFERFYRVDKSHSKEIGGSGLGLAITKSAVMLHDGAIKVTSCEGEGSTFLVRIPLTHII